MFQQMGMHIGGSPKTILLKKFLGVVSLAVLAACGTEPQGVTPQTSGTAASQEVLMPPPTREKRPSVVPAPAPFFNAPASGVAYGYAANANVQAFSEYYAQRGISRAALDDFFARAGYRANLIRLMDKPGTSRPWYEFRRNNVPAAKLAAGRRFYAANRAVIDRAAQQYGVPAEIIVAIIGIETNYGANKGNIRVADSLATLAFDYPRRGAFFQNELVEFLKLAQEEGRDPMGFTGSFAGAMGMPQFMPSSYRKWAVDFDGDGRRDIWNSVADTAASVANYMKVHGWQTGGRMIVPVALNITPQLQAVIDEKTALNYTVAQLKQMGVMPLATVSDHEKAVLFRLETAPNQYDYFIGLNNFYTVWQYNHSRMYVTAVRDIAAGVGAYGL